MFQKLKSTRKPGLVLAYNPSTQEDCEFEACLGHIAKSCLKKRKTKISLKI
jgi:hypothetical protein